MTEEAPQSTISKLPPPPEPQPELEEEEKEEEEPLFDLKSLLQARKTQPFGTGEVMAYAILADIMDRREDRREERMWRREQRMNLQSNKPNPEVEALKAEVAELRKTVSDLLEIIRGQRDQEAQKAFVEGVVKQTAERIMPELQYVKEKLAEYDRKMESGQKPDTSALIEIKESLREAIDKLGERVGSSGKTLSDVVSDVEKIMSLVDAVEKRMRRGEGGGEVDYRAMAFSTIGEIGKELVSAYRDISTARTEALAYQPPQPETPASAMQNIIKRQVQNYILNRMKAGATTINVQQAAQELGITPGQVTWAYQQLMKEGWFHVQIAKKTKGVKQAVSEAETPEEGLETGTETEGEGEQVFNPPPA